MSEFGFIEAVRHAFDTLPKNGFEGIGDDCAVYPVGNGESLLFTADMLGEGVHFLKTSATPFEIGAKSLSVNLSDIAAMGGTPIATLLSLGLTADATGVWAEEFMRGYRAVAEQFGVALVGGDTTLAQERISVNVTAVGRIANHSVKRRSAARAGDIIMVGGRLGASAAGLQDILAGNTDTPFARIHRNPQAQVREGIWLGAQSCVHAMMDLSDGLASDLVHILKASQVGATIEIESLPTDTTIENAVCGGEDYKLLFTVGADYADDLRKRFAQEFGTEIFPIGKIVSSEEYAIEWRSGGTVISPQWQGFSHF